jgi:hypothetical protein
VSGPEPVRADVRKTLELPNPKLAERFWRRLEGGIVTKAKADKRMLSEM